MRGERPHVSEIVVLGVEMVYNLCPNVAEVIPQDRDPERKN